MSTAIKTLKLPFLCLNRAKAEEFARLQALNTTVANALLALPQGERRALTSQAFAHEEIGSAWINQTIRNANARTKVTQFRCLPLETNNQTGILGLQAEEDVNTTHLFSGRARLVMPQ